MLAVEREPAGGEELMQEDKVRSQKVVALKGGGVCCEIVKLEEKLTMDNLCRVLADNVCINALLDDSLSCALHTLSFYDGSVAKCGADLRRPRRARPRPRASTSSARTAWRSTRDTRSALCAQRHRRRGGARAHVRAAQVLSSST